MFTRLLEVVGLKRSPTIGVFESLKPRELPEQVVVEGVANHQHHFKIVEWDHARLGPSVSDFDEDRGTPLEFPMATYKDLYRCSCGQEIVQSTRALI